MKYRSKSRRRQLEKIDIEELMGAAGMSGFAALLELPPVRAAPGWQPPAATRSRILVKAATLAEKLGVQTDVLRSLNEPLTRRVRSLERALGFLTGLTCAVSSRRTFSAAAPRSKGVVCAGVISSVRRPFYKSG